MFEFYKLYLPISKREIKIEIYIPSDYDENILYDSLYLLDGQNAFLDSHAAFGRSIRAGSYIDFAKSEMNKNIIGIGIHNSGSDRGRVNEYSPFLIQNAKLDNWKNNDVSICNSYCIDLMNTIIPFVENKYNINKNPNNRFIYGSSLAATTAIYLAFKYPNSFNYVGAFSTATFLFEDEFFKFLEKNKINNKNIFLYYGKNETSDAYKKEGLYAYQGNKLYKFFKDNNIRTKLVISANGIHNEENWDNHFLDFINFIYNDDIEYKK